MPSTAADFMPSFLGFKLDRRYLLTELLGAGSFGVVYKAVEIYTKNSPNPVYRAVKIVRKQRGDDDRVHSIRREVKLHSAVSKQRGVVRLIDAMEDSCHIFIILEYCGGGDLFDHISVKRSYEGNEELARVAFVSLIDAVQGCHDKGIAHRDLKPENILSNGDGAELYLADFGLATTKNAIKHHGCGTGAYMSPGTFVSCAPLCDRALTPCPLMICRGFREIV